MREVILSNCKLTQKQSGDCDLKVAITTATIISRPDILI